MSTVIQRKSFDPATTAVPSIDLVLDANITAGSTVAVFFGCSYGGTRGTFTVIDGGANSFTEASGAFVNGGFANLLDGHAFYYVDHPGGQATLTVDTNQNDFNNFKAWVIEFSGLQSFVAAEGTLAEATGTGTDAITSGNLTTVNNNDLLLAWTWDYDHASPGTGTLSAGTGFTSAAGDAVGNMIRGEYRTVVTPGSVAGTFTHSVSGNHITMAAAFKEFPVLTGQSITSGQGTPTVTTTRTVSVNLTGQSSTPATTAPTASIVESIGITGQSVTVGRGNVLAVTNYGQYQIVAANAMTTVDSIFANMGFSPADGDISYWPADAVNGVVLVPEISGGSITGRIATGPQTGTFTTIYRRLSNNTFYDWVVTLVDGTVTNITLTGQTVQSSSGASFVRVDIGYPIGGLSVTLSTTAPTVTGTANVSLTSQAVTTSRGIPSVSTNTAASIGLTGQSMTLSQGSVAASGNASPSLTGQQVTVSRGDITVQASSANATVNLIGQAITSGTSPITTATNVTVVYITKHMLEYVLGNTNI